jgi:hypothetical protein
MKKTTMALAALAVAVLALSVLGTEANATGRGGSNSQHQLCFWYKQKAMSTGEEYWWARWRACIRNHEI